MATVQIEISDSTKEKLDELKRRFKVEDDEDALNRTFDMAYFVWKTLSDPEKKLLVKDHDNYRQIKGWE